MLRALYISVILHGQPERYTLYSSNLTDLKKKSAAVLEACDRATIISAGHPLCGAPRTMSFARRGGPALLKAFVSILYRLNEGFHVPSTPYTHGTS